jgi:signal peptidase I
MINDDPPRRPGGPEDTGPESAVSRAGAAGAQGTGAQGTGAQGTGAQGTGARSGAAGPASDGRRAGSGKHRSFWKELPVLIAAALVLALLVKTYVVQAFFIPSSSMEDTLDIGDRILVNKLVYHFRDIHRGDIVVFSGDGSWLSPSPSSPDPLVRLWHTVIGLLGVDLPNDDFVKRVIGLPGDRVACCNASGLLTVNGVPLHESSYLYPGETPSAIPSGSARFSIIVPSGHLWVMGDHRLVSEDSRLRRTDPGGGAIPESAVVGRAFMIVWPLSRWRILPIPATFEQSSLSAATAAATAPASSLALGLLGAAPLAWARRRSRRRARSSAGGSLPVRVAGSRLPARRPPGEAACADRRSAGEPRGG